MAEAVADDTDLIAAATDGNRRAIGRLLTRIERGDDDLERALAPRNAARVVGLTGAPGAGKSTITGHLAAALSADARVAVLAIDPSSPVTGGAILGDRIRMDPVLEDADVFIRSMATRGTEGGLSAAAPAAIRLLDAVGFDHVIVETVGVGQVEVDIAAAADTTLVVVTPGWGDAVQANKAGLLEVADVFAVNKADRPGVDDARRDLEFMLDLSGDHAEWRPPIVELIATETVGISDLVSALDAHMAMLERTGRRIERRRARAQLEVRSRVALAADARLAHALSDADLAERIDAVAAGEATLHQVVATVVERVLGPDA